MSIGGFMGRKLNEKINIEKIKSDAEEAYINGEFYCSEAIVYSVRNNIAPSMPIEFLSASSGFPVGVGGSKCMCGAVTGAVVCLGYLFGRVHPTTITDPMSQKTMTLALELHDSFKKNHKHLCCHILTKGKDMENGEHKKQCAQFTGEMAAKIGEIVAREYGLQVVS
jgi:C_GCAxxG_C_C family probable redox protein